MPLAKDRNNWVTTLHFDNFENLDKWLSSDIRKTIMEE
jgi:antibiotic biosynthesis monooxygenase (ABM) superfamily enzyme